VDVAIVYNPESSSLYLFGGMPTEVIFRGPAPLIAGVMQINARVPADVTPGNIVTVSLQIGDAVSQPGALIALRSGRLRRQRNNSGG
jgi:uncharacterized protein (TIGR03437 family)